MGLREEILHVREVDIGLPRKISKIQLRNCAILKLFNMSKLRRSKLLVFETL